VTQPGRGPTHESGNTHKAQSPKATIRQAKGFAPAMTKMAFTGELKDVTDTVMANWRYC
jgi:hypothetical protein